MSGQQLLGTIVGIGNDILDITRIENMSEVALSRLAKRVLTTTEMQIFLSHQQPIRYLAKRWCAKEAAAKALGTGIAAGVSFKHFEINSRESGQPVLHLLDKALERANHIGAKSWHISISDEKKYATAFVVLSK